MKTKRRAFKRQSESRERKRGEPCGKKKKRGMWREERRRRRREKMTGNGAVIHFLTAKTTAENRSNP